MWYLPFPARRVGRERQWQGPGRLHAHSLHAGFYFRDLRLLPFAPRWRSVMLLHGPGLDLSPRRHLLRDLSRMRVSGAVREMGGSGSFVRLGSRSGSFHRLFKWKFHVGGSVRAIGRVDLPLRAPDRVGGRMSLGGQMVPLRGFVKGWRLSSKRRGVKSGPWVDLGRSSGVPRWERQSRRGLFRMSAGSGEHDGRSAYLQEGQLWPRPPISPLSPSGFLPFN